MCGLFSVSVFTHRIRPGLDQGRYLTRKLEAEQAANVSGVCKEWITFTFYL